MESLRSAIEKIFSVTTNFFLSAENLNKSLQKNSNYNELNLSHDFKLKLSHLGTTDPKTLRFFKYKFSYWLR